jgi:hypothetical protein
VVEELAGERSGEALRERVHVRSANGRPYDARADRLEDTSETSAELTVPIALSLYPFDCICWMSGE